MLSFLITAIKVIFLLGFLIFIHESGHFLVAKWFKVKVKEFSIGFGPVIWKKQGKETIYKLRSIPLGGFVNLLGEEEKVDEEGAFNKTSIPKRIGILIAGGTINIIFGLIIYFLLVAFITNSFTIALNNTMYFLVSIVDSLKQLFTGNVSINQLTGPIGISEMVAQTKQLIDFIYLFSVVSVSLGITNLLPFPPLDGGKVLFLLIEAIRRKPLKQNIEMSIQMAGFCLIIGLSLYVTYNDILNIF